MSKHPRPAFKVPDETQPCVLDMKLPLMVVMTWRPWRSPGTQEVAKVMIFACKWCHQNTTVPLEGKIGEKTERENQLFMHCDSAVY